MATSFINYAEGGTKSETTATCAKPTNTAENDIMFAHVSKGNNQSINSVPTGWTLIASGGTTYTITTYLYWKLAGASEPTSYTWGSTGNGQLMVLIFCYISTRSFFYKTS
jgi:hypothetical protein